LPIFVVHQEKKYPVILSEVTDRDVLSVAAIIGKSERSLVQHFEEALWAAFVLYIGTPVSTRCGKVETVSRGDELLQFGSHQCGKASLRFQFRISISGTSPFLNRLDRGGEGDVAR